MKVVTAGSKSGTGSANGCGAGGSTNGGDIEDLVASSKGGRPKSRVNGAAGRKLGRRKEPPSSVVDTVDVEIEGGGEEDVGKRRTALPGISLVGLALGLTVGVLTALAVARARRRG